MKKYLMGLVMVIGLSSGCMGWGFGVKAVKGNDNSVKKTQIAGAIVEKATGIEKAEVKATGVDMSKKIGVENISNQGVDMKTLVYIIGAFIGLLSTLMGAVIADQKLQNGRAFKQLREKDKIILDLANDQKEMFKYTMPILVLMHNAESYKMYADNKIEEIEKIEADIKAKIDKTVKKRFNIFSRKKKGV